MKLGLLGYPLGHSFSPKIFSIIFEETGTKGTYSLIEIPQRRLFYYFAIEALQNGYDGFNVTIPYKVDAYNLAEARTEAALRVKNANFIYLKHGKIVADNTDYYGFSKSLQRMNLSKAKKAAVIGYGGSARTVICVLEDLGFENVYVVARNPEKARKVLADFITKGKIELLANPAEFKAELDLIVNATPAGMYPETDVLPFGYELINRIQSGGLVYDLIYNPPETKLLTLARQQGLQIKNGLEMLVFQAVKSFANISDKKVNEDIVLERIQLVYGQKG